MRPCGDAVRITDTDSMHLFMPYLLPNRADNEAFINMTVDMTEANRFLEEKNAQNPEFKYTIFHLLTAAFAKTITMRPKLNRFYSGFRYYQRHDISFTFVAKKQFKDDAHEDMVFVVFDPDSDVIPLETVHDKVTGTVHKMRTEGKDDEATDIMGTLTKLPRPIAKFFVRIINWMEYHGRLPKSFVRIDPYHATAFLTNLGSIKLQAGYHHLANWGTNSIFIAIGAMRDQEYTDVNGERKTKKVVDMGITLDERIADGYYYSKTVRLIDYFVTHPELLMHPLNEIPEIDI